MKKLTTPTEVFEHIRDEMLGKSEEYICNSIKSLEARRHIDYSLRCDCLSLMCEYKPFEDSFIKYEYWLGCVSWWDVSAAISNNELHLVIEEKKRFLTYLISKL